MKLRLATLVLVALAFGSLASVAGADSFYIGTDKWGYEGTMTKYATLEDAQNQVNAIDSFVFPQRDGAIYIVKDHPAVGTNYTIAMTSWYYTTNPDQGAYSGWGNPNNTNTGFVQLYDIGGTTSAVSGGWTDANHDTFKVFASGSDAGADQYARLWHGATGGAASLTGGIFHEYALEMTAYGLSASLDSYGYMTSSDHPSMVDGYFRGIFENTGSNSAFHGFYRYDLTFNDLNWAWDNRDILNGEFYASEFSAAPVPEPMSMALVGLGLSAVAGLRKRSRKA